MQMKESVVVGAPCGLRACLNGVNIRGVDLVGPVLCFVNLRQ
jgi:hypothetical protein